MVQGQSVMAAFVDLVTRDEAEQPTDDSQVSGYVMLSRAKDPHKLWLLRAFPRELFTRGPPTGPHVLLKKLRGEVTLDDVDNEIKRLEEMKKTTKTVADPMKRLYRCTHCLLASREQYMKPPTAFGANSAAEIALYIDRHGAWTRCLACQEEASKQRSSPTPTLEASTPCIDPAGITCTVCKLCRPLHYYSASAVKNRKRNKSLICNACNSAKYCAGCSTWQQKKQFRDGAESCKSCQLITCGSCGEAKAQAQYRILERKHYFSDGRRAFCMGCRICSKCGKDKNMQAYFMRGGATRESMPFMRNGEVHRMPGAATSPDVQGKGSSTLL